jgi:hypothetical protein
LNHLQTQNGPGKMISLGRQFNASKIAYNQANVLFKNFNSNTSYSTLFMKNICTTSSCLFKQSCGFWKKHLTKLNKVTNEVIYFSSFSKMKFKLCNFIKQIQQPSTSPSNVLFNSKKTFRQFRRDESNFFKYNQSKPIFKENNSRFFNSFLLLFNLFLKNFNVKLELVKLRLLKNRSRFIASISAVGIFSWDEHRITDEDVKKEVNDIMKTFTSVNNKNENEENEYVRSIGVIDFEKNRLQINDKEWQLIYDKKDLIIWKRKIKGINEVGDLFEYKVLGRMYDITPLEFYQTQIDLEFRKQWDYLVVILSMIEKDTITNTELVRWVNINLLL